MTTENGQDDVLSFIGRDYSDIEEVFGTNLVQEV